MKLNLPRKTNRNGFTLIEVLISLFILSMISIGIYQAITMSFRLRESLSVEGEFYNSIRMAMTILSRDISLLYSPSIVLQATSSGTQKLRSGATSDGVTGRTSQSKELEDLQNTELGKSSTFWNGIAHVTGIRPSRLIGKDTSLSFISYSNARLYRESKESDFAKVSYELREDKLPEAIPGTKILTKIASPDIFSTEDEKDTHKKTYPLLRGIKSLEFTYHFRDKEKNDAFTYKTWDSDNTDYKDLFPDWIEVKISVTGTNRLSFDGVYLMKPEIPLDGLKASF